MKRISVLFLLFLFFCSCSSLSFDSSQSSQWGRDIKKVRQNSKGTVRILSVSADRSGEWNSLEREALDLLPLLFSEKSYRVVSQSQAADYSAEVKLREREFADGWRTKRSLSAEVRIWANNAAALLAGDTFEPLPLSAGRSLIQGKKSLASSKTLTSMLRKAVRNAVRGLPGSKR